MSLRSDGELAYAAAIERFKQGKCPGCGKGFGQRRGLEYRRGPNDLFCHTCRVSWPLELDSEVLRAKLPISDSPEHQTSDLPSVEAPRQDVGEEVGVATRLGRLFRRMLMR